MPREDVQYSASDLAYLEWLDTLSAEEREKHWLGQFACPLAD